MNSNTLMHHLENCPYGMSSAPEIDAMLRVSDLRETNRNGSDTLMLALMKSAKSHIELSKSQWDMLLKGSDLTHFDGNNMNALGLYLSLYRSHNNVLSKTQKDYLVEKSDVEKLTPEQQSFLITILFYRPLEMRGLLDEKTMNKLVDLLSFDPNSDRTMPWLRSVVIENYEAYKATKEKKELDLSINKPVSANQKIHA